MPAATASETIDCLPFVPSSGLHCSHARRQDFANMVQHIGSSQYHAPAADTAAEVAAAVTGGSARLCRDGAGGLAMSGGGEGGV